MKLPSTDLLVMDWPRGAIESWSTLTEQVKRLGGKAGKNDTYYQTAEQLKRLARTMDSHALATLMRKRVAARAMTQLWLEDAGFRESMFSQQILKALVQQQRGSWVYCPCRIWLRCISGCLMSWISMGTDSATRWSCCSSGS